MKLSKLKIRNFRCFGNEEKIIALDDLTTFIGINSCGKSAVLVALLKLFGRSASIRGLERSDFHVPKGTLAEAMTNQDLHIEAIIEFPELEMENDDIAKNTIPLAWQHFTVDEPDGSPYVRLRLEAQWKSGISPEGDIEQKYFFVTSSEEENDIPDEYKKPANNVDLSKIEIIYVPAIRNPEMQLKNASGTILWRILRGINWPATIHQQVSKIGKQVDEQLSNVGGFALLQEVLPKEWKKLHSDIKYTNVNVSFNADDFNELLGKLDARFFPTEIPGSYSVTSIGEGLRSLFYLSLVSSLLQLENLAIEDAHKASEEDEKQQTQKTPQLFNPDFIPPLLTVLAIEEPENHIAPHLLGRIMNVLNDVSCQSNVQVAITSHSTSIVKRVGPETIRYLRMCPSTLSTKVNHLKLPDAVDEKFKYIKESVHAYPEIYFSRFVVLGEGDSEEIVIPKALQLLGQSLDGSAVSVVPLGGRMVNHFWKLLESIDIPYATLLDLDLERGTGGWARIKYVIQQLREHLAEPNNLVSELINGEIISTVEEIQKLHLKKIDVKKIKKCLAILEKFGVFFAAPLDMDFMMLKAFPKAYIETVGDRAGTGPKIPDGKKFPAKRSEYVSKAISSVLKSEEATGKYYRDEDKDLMPWYKYLFLERGKPSTHLLAIAHLEDDEFQEKLPCQIKRLLSFVEDSLKKDPQSLLYQGGKDAQVYRC